MRTVFDFPSDMSVGELASWLTTQAQVGETEWHRNSAATLLRSLADAVAWQRGGSLEAVEDAKIAGYRR